MTLNFVRWLALGGNFVRPSTSQRRPHRPPTHAPAAGHQGECGHAAPPTNCRQPAIRHHQPGLRPSVLYGDGTRGKLRAPVTSAGKEI